MNKTLLLAALLACGFSTSAAFADSEMKPSYANKKSGRVAFEKVEAPSEAAAAQDAAMDAAKIEPAAGAEAEEQSSDESKLAEQMNLPRKN